MRCLWGLVLAALLMAGAPGAQAEGTAEYVIKVRGITVGSFRLTATQTGARYSVSGGIVSAGLATIVRRFSYAGLSRGILRGGRLLPESYREVADTGRRQSEVVIDYQDGVPTVTRYASNNPPGPDSPDPATQAGTLDPMSALFAVFRDRPGDAVCGETIAMFDGRRRSQLVLAAAQRGGARLRCSGEYRRLQGFTEKELSRHVAFPLTVIYAPNGNGGVHVERVEVTSVYGLATLDRR